jgi:hypothetical protein
MRTARVLGPALAVALAVVGALALTRDGDEPAAATTTTTAAPEPVAVTSDAPRLTALAELATASDVVLRGEVTATEHGRVFGASSEGAIESRLVTLRVTEVLAGESPPAGPLVVEEEGWLEDGTPIAVDGAAPSAVGDDAIWFLQAAGTDDFPVYVAVSAEGRYLVVGDDLAGAVGDDPLVAQLSALTPGALAAQVAALPSA